MSSLEMLKQLLDEFAEKEALVNEEINVIFDQIAQLEERMEPLVQRMSTIGIDREKIIGMRRRYLEGNFDAPKPAAATATPPLPAAAVTAGSVSGSIRPAPAGFAHEPTEAIPAAVAPVSEPVAAMPEPLAVEPEPVPAMPEPVPAMPEPVAAAPEPVAAAPEPVAATLPEYAKALPEPPAKEVFPVHAAPEVAEPHLQHAAPVVPSPPIPAAQSYPPPEPQKPRGSSSGSPLQELRKKFGIANILGGRKADTPPVPGWTADLDLPLPEAEADIVKEVEPERMPEPQPLQQQPPSRQAGTRPGRDPRLAPQPHANNPPRLEDTSHAQAAQSAEQAQFNAAQAQGPVAPPLKARQISPPAQPAAAQQNHDSDLQAASDTDSAPNEDQDGEAMKKLHDELRNLFS